jgi:hypothetical protein
MTDIAQAFPFLDDTNHRPTSPATPDYNCIGWAAGEDDRWWWPGPPDVTYWPPSVPRVSTCESFITAFSTIGYSVCSSGELEEGFDKVVLYADKNNAPTHMARQLPDGTWTSKLGQSIDINHFTLDAISGPAYGNASVFMRRPKIARMLHLV